jgi:hypothetical protein
LQNEVRTEEGDHLPIEFNMEDSSVEALGIGADLSMSPCLIRAAGGQEGEVPSIRHRAQLRLGCKVPIDGCGVIVSDTIAAEFRRPQLDRQMHPFQPFTREEATKQRIGDHGRLDARVMDQRLCGNSVQTGFGAAWLRRGIGTPLRKNIAKIHFAADQGESGEAASRKPEETGGRD